MDFTTLGRALGQALYRLGVLIVALALSGFFGFFVFGFGLFMPAPVARPLAFATAGLFAALGASWAANVLTPDRTRTELPAVVGLTLAVALALAAVDVVLLFTVHREGSAAATVLGVWVVLSLFAATAAWSRRSENRSLSRDLLLALGFFLGGILAIVGTVAVTCTLTPCVP